MVKSPLVLERVYVMDRAYLDFDRLCHMNECLCYFVIREKNNFKYRRVYSNKVDKYLGFGCDQIIKLTGFYTAKKYPGKLKRIKFHDKARDRRLVFITNNFAHSAQTIAQLYKERWRIELFLKWTKQHLRIKKFLGTTAMQFTPKYGLQSAFTCL